MKHKIFPKWRIAAKNYKKSYYLITEKDSTPEFKREVQVVLIHGGDHPIKDFRDRIRKNVSLIVSAPAMATFIQEIQQAFTDKSKGGTPLSVQEHCMLLTANKLLKKLK